MRPLYSTNIKLDFTDQYYIQKIDIKTSNDFSFTLRAIGEKEIIFSIGSYKKTKGVFQITGRVEDKTETFILEEIYLKKDTKTEHIQREMLALGNSLKAHCLENNKTLQVLQFVRDPQSKYHDFLGVVADRIAVIKSFGFKQVRHVQYFQKELVEIQCEDFFQLAPFSELEKELTNGLLQNIPTHIQYDLDLFLMDDPIYFAAFYHSELIGFFGWRKKTKDNSASIDYLFVLPEHRNKGYGQKLHLQALGLMKKHAFSCYYGTTEKENLAMEKIFLRNGCELLIERIEFGVD